MTVTGLSVSLRWYHLCFLDDETQCRTALTGWIVENGERTYYDRLSRALQHIGRTDIAIGEKKRTHVPLRNYIRDDLFYGTKRTIFKLEQPLLEG